MTNEELKIQIVSIFPNDAYMWQKAYDFIKADAQHRDEQTTFTTLVDLGLPSGTLWADRNLGADSPEKTGLYFSLGDTEGHEAGSGYSFDREEYSKTTGSNLREDIDTENDAATVMLGSKWQMPTREQFLELYDNCDTEWASLNGQVGMKFTSRINGNSVFFPAAGNVYNSSLYDRGSYGYYWSRSLYSSDGGYFLSFDSSSVYPQNDYYRYRGFSVRAVYKFELEKQ